jgi:type 1 glutamine amidotransferase
VAAALALLASVATAQLRLADMPRGAIPILLLGQESVRKELKLSPDQVKQLAALQKKWWGQGQALASLKEPERGRKIEQMGRESAKALADILSAEQARRLKQIVYQQQGTAALGEPDVAQALGLTDDQQEQIRQASEETKQKVGALARPGAVPGKEARARIKAIRKAGSDRALAVLTADQKAAWKGLQGAPFKGAIGFGGPPPADPARFLDRITKALPDSAPAKPRQRRKLLVFSRTLGFRHPSIPVGVRAITLMGDKTGAFVAYHTEDESVFEPEKLKTFDAVLMLNTTGDCLRPAGLDGEQARQREEVLKKGLVDFVAGGKGLAGIHAATDTYHGWKEYNRMMGGVFAGHPWTEKVPVKNLEPAHPLNAMFGGKDFEIFDEIYQFSLTTALPTERRFLLALDTAKMPEASRGNRQTAGPYPVSWVSTYGKGRTFYCSLGHREEIYCEPAMLRHYLAGLQYVLGDLDVDASPTARSATHGE